MALPDESPAIEPQVFERSAAPVFKDIAAWLLNHENIPPSPEAKPYVLQQQ